MSRRNRKRYPKGMSRRIRRNLRKMRVQNQRISRKYRARYK